MKKDVDPTKKSHQILTLKYPLKIRRKYKGNGRPEKMGKVFHPSRQSKRYLHVNG